MFREHKGRLSATPARLSTKSHVSRTQILEEKIPTRSRDTCRSSSYTLRPGYREARRGNWAVSLIGTFISKSPDGVVGQPAFNPSLGVVERLERVYPE